MKIKIKLDISWKCFTMLDGQHVTVNSGDTLWAIAHGKLMEMSLNFYKRVGPSRGNARR